MPEVPVTVRVAVPAVAEALAVRVRMLFPDVLAGLNDAVTPLGRPDTARFTLFEKPFDGPTTRLVMAVPPCCKPTLAEYALRVKFGTTITRLMGAVWIRAPDEPVMVTVVVPAATVDAALKVTELVPVVLAGLNEAVTPLGKPEAVSVTVLEKPLCGVMVSVLVPLVPGITLTPAGEAERVKFGLVMVRVMLAVLFALPAAPVTVTLAVAATAVADATNVRVLLAVVVAGLKLALTPLGKPVTVRLTVLLNSLPGLTVRVLPPLLPQATLTVLGAAASVKVGTTRVRVKAAVLFTVPEVPVTVTVKVPAATALDALRVSVL